jgi:DNA-binding IscR family transcriptional regulator
MKQVHDAMASVLDNTTVSDLLRGVSEQPNRILMFDI